MSCLQHMLHEDNCPACCEQVPFAALQMLMADNARMCEIVIAADKLAKAVENAVYDMMNQHVAGLELALDAFKVVRNGQ